MRRREVLDFADQRADLYYTLAEALADIPSWLMLPGREWPLNQAAMRLFPDAPTVQEIAQIPAESEQVRRDRHARLFSGPGRPRFWLYESMWRSGRFLGPETITLEKVYKKAGMSVTGAEAADHASVELAFLAHLSKRRFEEPDYSQEWWQLEKSFIKKHAGQWLPALGHSLAKSGDEVYGPIGALMGDFLSASERPRRKQLKSNQITPYPVIDHQELCTLCGFCAQGCPHRALVIRETNEHTFLQLSKTACTGCSKCINICPAGVLKLSSSENLSETTVTRIVLRQSPRVHCPACGRTTVSRAELDFVAGQIGRPNWLPYCLPCRSALWEKNYECSH